MMVTTVAAVCLMALTPAWRSSNMELVVPGPHEDDDHGGRQLAVRVEAHNPATHPACIAEAVFAFAVPASHHVGGPHSPPRARKHITLHMAISTTKNVTAAVKQVLQRVAPHLVVVVNVAPPSSVAAVHLRADDCVLRLFGDRRRGDAITVLSVFVDREKAQLRLPGSAIPIDLRGVLNVSSRMRALFKALIVVAQTRRFTAVEVCGLEVHHPMTTVRQSLRFAWLDVSLPLSEQSRIGSGCDPLRLTGCLPLASQDRVHCLRLNAADRDRQVPLLSSAGNDVSEASLNVTLRSYAGVLVSITTSTEPLEVILDNLDAWLYYCGPYCALVIDNSRHRIAEIGQEIRRRRRLRVFPSSNTDADDAVVDDEHVMLVILQRQTFSDRYSNTVAPRHIRNVELALVLLGAGPRRVLFAAANEIPFRHGLADYLLAHTSIDLQDPLSAAPEALLDSCRTWEDPLTFGASPRAVAPSWALLQPPFIRSTRPDDDGGGINVPRDFTQFRQYCNRPTWDRPVRAGLPIPTLPVAFEGLWMNVETFKRIASLLDIHTLWDYRSPLEHTAFSSMLLAPIEGFVTLREAHRHAPIADLITFIAHRLLESPSLGVNTCVHVHACLHDDPLDDEPNLTFALDMMRRAPSSKFTFKRVSRSNHSSPIRAALRRRRSRT